MATPPSPQSPQAMTRAQVSDLSYGLRPLNSGCDGWALSSFARTDAESLLQEGMALLKFLQTNQIFPAALAFHTFLLTAMAQTGMWATLPP